MRRAIGVTAAPGIAQATYDAAVAKLVAVSEWVDLTATITTACAGAAAADPDSLAAGLTVASSTGTFDGATIPCNSFAWTTHTTTNDGYGETLNYDLGTIASLISGYDPATQGLQLVARLVEIGTLNSARPAVSVAVASGGTLTGNVPVSGWAITSATSVASLIYYGSTSRNVQSGGNPTGVAALTHTRLLRTAATRRLQSMQANVGGADSYQLDTRTYTQATDALMLLLGQENSTAGAVSGLKIAFGVRTFAIANLTLSDLDLGVQA